MPTAAVKGKGPAAAAATRRQPKAAPACGYCRRPLPAGSTPRRRYCSSACRTAAWNASNPAPGQQGGGRAAPGAEVPLHWHGGTLRGSHGLGYHRAAGCPPGCDVPLEAGGWACGVPPGREGLMPPRGGWYAEPVQLRPRRDG